ncbi:MAG: CHAT domain-containing protein, partial [Ktedonobacteraceae bacterium]
ALDFNASLSTAMDPRLGGFHIVHFATHGLLDSARPEFSGLLLSLVDERGFPKDGFLGLEDIYSLNLPVDLVVLSACQTALGKVVEGEGLLSLTRGFMHAGASRVIASLWSVNDLATSELMAKFYRIMHEEKIGPARALRKAQLDVWKQKRWHSPYYWAAFQIQGEWN